ncbi:MAG: hypothetical protein AB1457_18025 [Chloroflexota bacterium]|jgi:tetratricopeptide (TPR) repeat protein
MNTSALRIFVLGIVLLSPIAAHADRLYETNLLKQDGFKEQLTPDVNAIEQMKAEIKREPERKSEFLFEIATLKARQGQLKEALSDLNKTNDKYLVIRPDYLEERAEIKSLLGLHPAALLDIDSVLNRTSSGEWQKWRTLWHKSIILERAGKTTEAELRLREAKANLDRFQTNGIFEQTFSKVVMDRHLKAIEPEPKKADNAISLIQSLLKEPSCPKLNNTIELLGLNTSPEKNQQTREDKYIPLSPQSPLRYATITPEGNQIRLYLDTTSCLITPEDLKKNFDVGTDKELWPDGMGGCGPATLALYPKNSSTPAMFLFDGAKKQGLCMFFISFKSAPRP